MYSFFKWVFWITVATLVASLALGGWLAHEVVNATSGTDWHLVLDDDTVFDADSSELALGLGSVLVALVVGVVALVVVPLVLIVGVGVPLLAVLCSLGAVLFALAGVAALLFAPLLLPLLLVWWLARRKPVARAGVQAPKVAPSF
jgi:hypothetical protein